MFTLTAALVFVVSFQEKKEPALAVDKSAKIFARFNQAELVFSGKVAKVFHGAVAYTDPPGFSDDLSFGDVTILRGNKPAKMIFIRSVTQPEAPQYPKEITWLVAADRFGEHWAIRFIVPLDEKTLTVARQAVTLPLGWSLSDGQPVSPWASLGKKAWPREEAKGPVCSKSGRPALFGGAAIEFTAAQVLPAQRDEFRNPYGDGQFELTVTNRGDKPAIVPALLTDGKTIFWEDSLVILCLTDASGPHLLPRAGLPRGVESVSLQAGASVSTTIDVLPLQGIRWAQGGWRMYFRFCLGEKSTINFFYYNSRHHDALRNAALKK